MALLLINTPDNRSAQQILMSRPLGTYRHRQKDNIKMDLTQTVRECVDRIPMAQDSLQWGDVGSYRMQEIS